MEVGRHLRIIIPMHGEGQMRLLRQPFDFIGIQVVSHNQRTANRPFVFTSQDGMRGNKHRVFRERDNSRDAALCIGVVHQDIIGRKVLL
ncbi:hypothetical protein ES703_87493 [subsurface metagenome]